ncbi:MAG: YciI family protein [Pseudonocardiaceae bacterium]
MAQYLLSVHMVEGEEPPTPDAMAQAYKDVDRLNQQMMDQGAWVFAGGLQPADTATVVAIRDGEVLTTDGPFAETKEHLGGFWVLEAADFDAALAWTTKATTACLAPIEIRQFQEEPPG